MSRVQIFYNPTGMELDALGAKEYLHNADGDTPCVSMPIRMLGIDTPETHYPGNQKPSKMDKKLAQLGKWLKEQELPINKELSEYLYPKLITGQAGTLQEEQGKNAKTCLEKLIESGLKTPNGGRRRTFLRAANLPFDRYGRLLAYVAPNYNAEELASMPREKRETFNLLMVKEGWAASFLLYPNIPGYKDLMVFHQAAKDVFENRKGIWKEKTALTGYEFRSCVKLYEAAKKADEEKNAASLEKSGWLDRFCVDITTKEIFYPEEYYKVPPYNRLFIWPNDINEAVGKMGLIPAR